MIVTTGQTRTDEGYSAMAGEVAGRGTLLADLQARKVDHLYVGGLATDYCVKHSVLDALHNGIGVTVLTDAIRAVDLKPGDAERALEEMRQSGAEFATSKDIL
jgi:nicotinamidase/pyrazinamidase